MAHPARNRAGFTLLELLIAMLISSIVMGTVFQFLLDQGRFVRYQSAREEVQQNTRASLDLISSELRAVSPQGLEGAFKDSIAFRAPRIWGAICAIPAGTTTVHLAVPASLGINYSVGGEATQPMLVADVSAPSATQRQWTTSRTITAISATPSSVCNGANLTVGTEMRAVTLASVSGLAVGNTAYLYDRVSYAPGSSNVPGLWIRRRAGTAAYQPFAGPIREGTNPGFGFRYYRIDGTELIPPAAAGLSEADRLSVGRIEITVESVSRQKFGGSPQSKLNKITVFLRNRA